MIHGGYWRSLEPALFSHWAAGMNRHGHSVAVLGYRLCPEVAVADIVADIRAAILHLSRRFAAPFVVAGHSAGGHLASTAVAADWHALGVPSDLLRHGLAVSGVFDLAPLVETSMNADLRLDLPSARALSPAFWDVPSSVMFEAWVGEAESSEFLRQSRFLAERWSAAGASARSEIIPGANHFNAAEPLADPASRMVAALVRLAEKAANA